MLITDRINKKLNENLNISKLLVEDESDKHLGHSGYQEGGETHFKITVISCDFIGMNKILRHKRIYKILEQEIADRIHALSIIAKTPEEDL